MDTSKATALPEEYAEKMDAIGVPQEQAAVILQALTPNLNGSNGGANRSTRRRYEKLVKLAYSTTPEVTESLYQQRQNKIKTNRAKAKAARKARAAQR